MRRWRKRSMAETNPWQRDKPLFNPPPRRQMLGNPRKKKPAAGEKPLPALAQVNVRRKKPRIDRHGKSGFFQKGASVTDASDFLVGRLLAWGVDTIFGFPGDGG